LPPNKDKTLSSKNFSGVYQIVSVLRPLSVDLGSHILKAWRAECERQNEATIDAIRATAQEQVPFNVQTVSIC
jgi:hypothetical protein